MSDDLDKLFKKLNEEHKDKMPRDVNDILRRIRQRTKNTTRTDEYEYAGTTNPETSKLRALIRKAEMENEIENDPVWKDGYERGYYEAKTETIEWCKLLVRNLIKLYDDDSEDIPV